MNKYRLCVLVLCVLIGFAAANTARADTESTTPAALNTSTIDTSSSTSTDAAATSTLSATSTTIDLSTTSIASSTAPAPSPIAIGLEVETSTTTLFDGPLSVSACPVAPGSATSTISGYCALLESGLANNWSWYGDDAFLTTLEGVSNDDRTGQYWTWFADLTMGEVALNKHPLSPGETLLLTIGRMPLRLTLSTTSPILCATTTATVERFGFDANYNALWSAAASSTLHLGTRTLSADAFGTVAFVATTTDTLDLYATQGGFLPSSHLTVTPQAALAPASEVTAGAGGTPYVPPTSSTTPGTTGALAYLLGQQQADGSFGEPFLSDWAALALVAAAAPASTTGALSAYLDGPLPLASATDYERHALALEALGHNPGALVAHIMASFDGTQFGDPTLINDDLFALLTLPAAGYSVQDAPLAADVAFVLSKQAQNGAWESADLTAAAVQALAPLSSFSGVPAALARARVYLAAQEDAQGCIGNVYTTSWALQAIAALGESPSAWHSATGATPLSCLAALQQQDGGFGALADSPENRVWATAYALPALKGDAWSSLLHTFVHETALGAPAPGAATPSIATSAPIVGTTTPVTAPPPSLSTTPSPSTTTLVAAIAPPTPAPEVRHPRRHAPQAITFASSRAHTEAAAVQAAEPSFITLLAKEVWRGFLALLRFM